MLLKSMPLSLSPSLPVSENYGKSFQDVTNLINNTFIRTEYGIAIGPENSGKVGGGLATKYFYFSQLLSFFHVSVY